MADSVSKIVEQLRSEEARLEKEVASAAEKMKAAKCELKRVRSGIVALEGQGSGGSGKPAPKKADVSKAAISLLKEKGEIASSQLEELVANELANAGFSKSGLSLRIREFLRSDAVEAKDGKLRLNNVSVTSTNTQ